MNTISLQGVCKVVLVAAAGLVLAATLLVSGPARPASAVDAPTPLTISLEKVANPNRSEDRAIVRIHVVGGKVGTTLQPFKNGLTLVFTLPNMPDVTVGGSLEDAKEAVLYVGDKRIGTPKKVTSPAGRNVYVTFNDDVPYAVTTAGQEKIYTIKYKPVLLAQGQNLEVRLMNGHEPFLGKFSHYGLDAQGGFSAIDPLKPAYAVTYGTLATSPALVVENGKAFQAIRDYLNDPNDPNNPAKFHVVVYDHGRMPLAGLQLIKATLDAFGVDKFPLEFKGVRIMGITPHTEGTGPWVTNTAYSKPAQFVGMLTHEAHHAINKQLVVCGLPATDPGYANCRAKDAATRTLLGSLGTRITKIIQRAGGTDGNNYLRTNITLRTVNAVGHVASVPTDPGTWAATFNTFVGRGDVYTLQPYITFTSGVLQGTGDYEVDDYENGVLSLMGATLPAQPPQMGDTFVIRGGGADFFTQAKRPQEFLASLSQAWISDSAGTWAKCIAAYRLGRPVVMDQCLLFVDLYAAGSGTTPFFKDTNGVLTKTYYSVTRDSTGRVVSIPAVGPETFSLGTDGLVQFVRGDVNIDTRITAADALGVLRVAVQTAPSSSLLIEDADCSGKITVTDSLIILKTAVGLRKTPITCTPTDMLTQIPQISVTKTGTGSGIIEPTVLTATGYEVTFGFKATAGKRSEFKGWSGACTGMVAECRFTTNGSNPVTLTARFDSTTSLTAAVFEAFGSLTPSMLLMVLCQILFFVGFGLHYFYPNRIIALVLAVIALLTGVLMFVNGLIG